MLMLHVCCATSAVPACVLRVSCHLVGRIMRTERMVSDSMPSSTSIAPEQEHLAQKQNPTLRDLVITNQHSNVASLSVIYLSISTSALTHSLVKETSR